MKNKVFVKTFLGSLCSGILLMSSIVPVYAEDIVELTETPVCITITWDEEIDGVIYDIEAYVSGLLDDGATVEKALTEGEYFSSIDDSPVGSHYIYGYDRTELWFYRLDGIYDISLEWGNVDAVFSGVNYSDVDLNIAISTEDEVLLNIAANMEKAEEEGRENLVSIEDYYYRAGTGVWCLGFNLDHGKILPINMIGETAADEIPVEENEVAQEAVELNKPKVWVISDEEKEKSDSYISRIEEQYTDGGQLQSVEKYNEDDHKVVSEWYEGEVITAYTYWDYDENNNLVKIRYMNVMEPDEVQIDFVYDGSSVKMYNQAGMLLAEGDSAYATANQLGMGYLVEESWVTENYN